MVHPLRFSILKLPGFIYSICACLCAMYVLRRMVESRAMTPVQQSLHPTISHVAQAGVLSTCKTQVSYCYLRSSIF